MRHAHLAAFLLGCADYEHTCSVEDPSPRCPSTAACDGCGAVPDQELEPLASYPLWEARGLPPVALARSSAEWAALQDGMASGHLPFVPFDPGTAAALVTVEHAGCAGHPWLEGVWQDGADLIIRIGGTYHLGEGCLPSAIEDPSMAMVVVLETDATSASGCAVVAAETLLAGRGDRDALPETGELCVGELAFSDTGGRVPLGPEG